MIQTITSFSSDSFLPTTLARSAAARSPKSPRLSPLPGCLRSADGLLRCAPERGLALPGLASILDRPRNLPCGTCSRFFFFGSISGCALSSPTVYGSPSRAAIGVIFQRDSSFSAISTYVAARLSAASRIRRMPLPATTPLIACGSQLMRSRGRAPVPPLTWPGPAAFAAPGALRNAAAHAVTLRRPEVRRPALVTGRSLIREIPCSSRSGGFVRPLSVLFSHVPVPIALLRLVAYFPRYRSGRQRHQTPSASAIS